MLAALYISTSQFSAIYAVSRVPVNLCYVQIYVTICKRRAGLGLRKSTVFYMDLSAPKLRNFGTASPFKKRNVMYTQSLIVS